MVPKDHSPAGEWQCPPHWTDGETEAEAGAQESQHSAWLGAVVFPALVQPWPPLKGQRGQGPDWEGQSPRQIWQLHSGSPRGLERAPMGERCSH